MARIDFTRGFHFRGGDTPSFGLDGDVVLYRAELRFESRNAAL